LIPVFWIIENPERLLLDKVNILSIDWCYFALAISIFCGFG
jgi:hypothetical protein